MRAIDARGDNIKSLVFSMTVVLILIMGSVTIVSDPLGDSPLVMGAAASLSVEADAGETLWLDAYSLGDPTTFSSNPLKEGGAYKITVEGTFSAWETDIWNDEEDPPWGAVEVAPMYPGLGGEQTGPVGVDPYYGFACPLGEDYAQSIGAWPLPWWWTTMISQDNGGSWNENIRPIHDVYNPLHKYEVVVIGNGELIGFRIFDSGSNNNYGMLKIVITPDTDDDGLFDDWEMGGIDINNDGTVDFVLNDADHLHKDIFVEVDYMEGHRPMDASMNDVKVAFSRAPNDLVCNPDEMDGVNLHIDVDEQIIHQDLLQVWAGFDSAKSSYFGSLEQRAATNRDDLLLIKKWTSRYCLFIHELAVQNEVTHIYEPDTSAGKAETRGNDFIVALGVVNGGTRDQQAAAFMHELGHTLGLRHGGGDDENYKPNYLSVMNYLFMMDGDPIPNRPLDYSRSALPTINEQHLSELDGISPNIFEPSYHNFWIWTAHSDSNGNENLDSLNPIDWDNSGSFENDVAADINNFIVFDHNSGELTNLSGSEDWSNLFYLFYDTWEFDDGVHLRPIEEISWETLEKMHQSAFTIHDVAILNVTCTSDSFEVGETFEVNITLMNGGTFDEDTEVHVMLGPTEIASQGISLAAGQTKSVRITRILGDDVVGSHPLIIQVTHENNEFNPLDNSYDYGDIQIDTGGPEEDTPSWVWIMAIGVAVVTILIAYMVIRRRKG